MTVSPKGKTSSNSSNDSEELKYRIDIATQVLERNIGFINSCDNKTSIILTAIGVVLTLIVTNKGLYEIVETIEKCITSISLVRIIYLICFIFAIIIMGLGIFNLGSVLIAKTTENAEGIRNVQSHIFFSGICKNNNYEKYSKSFRSMNLEELLDETIEQIYINADIANNKYAKYNLGLKQIVMGFMLFVIVLIIGALAF